MEGSKTKLEVLFELRDHLQYKLGRVEAAIKMFQDDPELEKKLNILETLRD